jgi:hypothetical protein
MGEPFDPSCEGPSEDDVRRFGDESEYAEYEDDYYGAIGREGGADAPARSVWKTRIMPFAMGLTIVAVVVVWVLP